MRHKALFAVLVAVCAGTYASAGASTPVEGRITSDTTWTRDDSPYVLSGDVTVTDGARLTIEPGVEVSGSGRLIVLASTGANLSARGTASAPIQFGASGLFGGMVFTGDGFVTSDSALDHVRISHASTGVDLQGVSVPISNAAFSNNGRGVSFNVVDLTITDSVFARNASTGIRGMARGQVTISGSAFWNNGASIAILAARTCSCNVARWEIHGNDLLRGPDSGPYDVTVGGNTATTSDTYGAAGNWWGTTAGAEIEARIYDGDDDGLEKTVEWAPPSAVPNTGFVEPEPTEPPSPPDDGAARSVSLVLRRHLTARGEVSSDEPICKVGVVRLERRAAGEWTTVKSAESGTEGRYRVTVPDRAGRYRTLVDASEGCGAASSVVRRHRH